MQSAQLFDNSKNYRTYSTEGYELFESKKPEEQIALPASDVSHVGEPEFEETIYANIDGSLIVGRNMEAVLPIIYEQKKGELSECDDYKQVYSSLAKLTNEKNISFRQFARLDKSYRASYELLREGNLVWSDLNWLLNGFDRNPESHLPNKMKFDGSALPEDYSKHAAPFLGPSGWVMETEQDGWRVTGCVLKK